MLLFRRPRHLGRPGLAHHRPIVELRRLARPVGHDLDEQRSQCLDSLGIGRLREFILRPMIFDHLPVLVHDTGHHVRLGQPPAVGQGTKRRRQLDRRDRHFLPHRHRCGAVRRLPTPQRHQQAPILARQVDPGLLPEPKSLQRLVHPLIAHPQADLGHADVAGLREDLLDGQVAIRLMIVQQPPPDREAPVVAEKYFRRLNQLGRQRPSITNGLKTLPGSTGSVSNRLHRKLAFTRPGAAGSNVGDMASEDLPGLRAHHHAHRALGLVLLPRLGQLALDDLLHGGVDA